MQSVKLGVDSEGGHKVIRNVDVDESGDVGIAGKVILVGGYVSNMNAAARYLKLYDKATAPTVGTDTPTLTIGLNPTSTISLIDLMGTPFTAGIGVGATTAAGDADTGAPGANDVLVNLFYV